MSGWPILDVAIGLCFVYLLLSTVCTALTEGVTTQLGSRARFLERGIEALLGEDENAKKEFFSHPVIATFTHRGADTLLRRIFRFVFRRSKERNGPRRTDRRPSYLPGDKFAIVVRELADKRSADGKFAHESLSKAVESVRRGVSTNADEIKALHEWYDQVMERVTGWYKRHAQSWVRVFAVIVVIALNADTVHIANVLWIDPTIRQQTVELAKTRAQQPAPEAVSIEYTDADETLPEEEPEQIGTAGDSSDQRLGVTGEQWQLLQKLMGWDDDAAKLKQDLAALGKTPAAQAGIAASTKFDIYQSWMGYVLRRHAVGWFITMVAVSLGAPFWYAALNRLINIRNAGSKPATQEGKTTVEEKQK